MSLAYITLGDDSFSQQLAAAGLAPQAEQMDWTPILIGGGILLVLMFVSGFSARPGYDAARTARRQRAISKHKEAIKRLQSE